MRCRGSASAGTLVAQPDGIPAVGRACPYGAGIEGVSGAEAGSAVGRSLGAALGNWVQGWFAAKNKPAAKPNTGARGGSCPAASSSRPPKKGPLKGKNAAEEAKRLGYNKKMPWRSHGQPVFGDGDGFITPDVDSQSGDVWKLLDRAGRRIATLDGNGNVIGE